MDRRRVLALACAALAGCGDGTGERTRRDQVETGRAALGLVQARLEPGVALTVDPARPFVRFRANAPAVVLVLASAAASDVTVAVELTNVVDGSEADVAPTATGPKLLGFTLVVPAGGEARLAVRPPGGGAAAPFRFAWVGDVQGGNETFVRIRERIDADPSLAFTLFAGDVTEQGSEGEIDAFVAVADGLDRPWYSLLGNHDCMSGEPLAFQRTVGRIDLGFDYQGARFVLLDSTSATLDPWAFELVETLLVPAAPATRIVAMHLPPFDPGGLRDGGFSDRAEAARLLAILAGRGVDLLLAGHLHTLLRTSQAGIETWISGDGGVGMGASFDGVGAHYLAIAVDPVGGVISVVPVMVD